jgi:hypothetical protein
VTGTFANKMYFNNTLGRRLTTGRTYDHKNNK